MRPKGAPEQVLVHDFLIPDLGRVSPYGVYDIAQNEAWVSVGTDHDTAAFAVEASGVGGAAWGRLYPSATRLLITADAGGSNGYRLRLWKLGCRNWRMRRAFRRVPPPTRDQQVEQDRTPLVLRDQSELARKAAGQPEVVVNLIGATTTRTGLRVQSQLDTNRTRPGAPRTTNSKPSICVETLSMVNGIIRCYPALRCSIELIIS